MATDTTGDEADNGQPSMPAISSEQPSTPQNSESQPQTSKGRKQQRRPPTQKPKQAQPTGDPTICDGCGQTFASRNAVFRHLKETNGACLLEHLPEQDKQEQYKAFQHHIRLSDKLKKVLILYGYLPFSVMESDETSESLLSIHNGQDAGRILMTTIQELQNDLDGVKPSIDTTTATTPTTANQPNSSLDRLNRSYGNISRVDDCIRQDPDTAAITEVMAVRLRPLRMTEDEWLDRVQERLDDKYKSLLEQSNEGETNSDTTPVRILGRLELPNANFNAETDVTQRRMEYLLPIDFLTWSMENGAKTFPASDNNTRTRPATVSSSVTPSRSMNGSSKNRKAMEGWDIPPPIAIPSSKSKSGWENPQHQWKTPQRIASLSPVEMPPAPTNDNPRMETSAALFDETNGGGRMFCAPCIVSNGRCVLVASGATLFLYQVTSAFQQPLSSLPLPARSIAPISKLTLVLDDAPVRDRPASDSKKGFEQQKRLGDIQQMIYLEESSIVYVLTADCCVVQLKLHSPSVDAEENTISINPQAKDAVQSASTDTKESLLSTASSRPSLSIWRKFQTTEFGASCMATLHDGGGAGSDSICVGYNSGVIECWHISHQQPEMMKSLHESRRPQRREKPSVLRWKGYMEQSVKTLVFMRQMRIEDNIDQRGTKDVSTPTKEGVSQKSDNLPVSSYCLLVSSQTSPGSDNKQEPCSLLTLLDLKRIYEEEIELPRKEIVSLQKFALQTLSSITLNDTSTVLAVDESTSRRSPMLGTNCADAATLLSNREGKSAQVGVTFPDGSVSLFSCSGHRESGTGMGINRDSHSILLPFPAIGSGALHIDDYGKEGQQFLACCLRGGTCYFIPADEDACDETVTVIQYPHDLSSDLDQVYIQAFAAGNLRVGSASGPTPVIIFALPGGMVDIYTCELLSPKPTVEEAVLSKSALGDNFGARIRKDLPLFSENHKHDINHVDEAAPLPEKDMLEYLTDLKNIMKLLRTRIVAVDLDKKASVWEKQNNVKRRKQQKSRRTKKEETLLASDEDTADRHDDVHNVEPEQKDVQEGKDPMASPAKPPQDETKLAHKVDHQQNYLKRKRFHNFTASVMAHQYLAYRRLDRLYHRATLELPNETDADQKSKFAVLSMSGDIFLTGQAQRIIGVFIALANGVIDKDFVDCVFDEDYPHLVPTPPAPPLGSISAEAHYMNTEGKIKSVLSPRVSNEHDRGFNRKSTLMRVKEWKDLVHNHIAMKWESNGRESPGGRLTNERRWTENILLPWAEKARNQLDDYRVWKRNQSTSGSIPTSNASGEPPGDASASVIPSISNIDPTIPEAFEEVLQCLREVDASGDWPSTTPKRQLVMVSTQDGSNGDGEQPDSLAIAHSKAKRNVAVRSSAYSFAEGQGGASGSFSVGYMPGGTNKQPKSNSLFPKLVKAAFDLEVKLYPHREPSSTIAINRNAQFRPHTDSGDGAGQSTSLIVGLGTYSGGELMVEGDQYDIRYKAIEFNGWKQRHWTLPFMGERYSLVWFTPKGCEGMRGIDLDL